MDIMTIDILLSTYNGESHINDQLNSIVAQTWTNWNLVVRDDGSSDTTIGQINTFANRFPGKFHLIEQRRENLGACQSFGRLLAFSKSNYVMFCDQDDIWLPDKVKITFNRMKDLEDRFGKHTPLLIHTDAKVVDHNLNTIAPSFWRYQRNDPERGGTLKRLLLQNVVTGCTVMINKALRDMAMPIPSEAMMHDWWLALVAAAFGHLSPVSEPTLLYRQHDRNDLGAKRWDVIAAARQLADLLNLQHMLDQKRQSVDRLQKQAESFLHQYYALLTDKDKAMVAVFSRLSQQSYLKRRYCMIKYGFFYTDVFRNVGMFFFR